MRRVALIVTLAMACSDEPSVDEVLNDANKTVRCDGTWRSHLVDCARVCRSKPPVAIVPEGETCDYFHGDQRAYPDEVPMGSAWIVEVDGVKGFCYESSNLNRVSWFPCFCSSNTGEYPPCD